MTTEDPPDPPEGWLAVLRKTDNRDAPLYYKKGRGNTTEPEIRFRNGEFIGYRESGSSEAVFVCPSFEAAIVAYELMF